jgi:hypothetical protein
MKVIRDCFGTSVRLTDERLAHILEHVEMAVMADELERVLQTPSEVRRSRSDDDVKLFYEFQANPSRWEMVVCSGKVSTGRRFRDYSIYHGYG